MLAPLALLLVLEARCAHFVIENFNYFVLWSSASLAPTQHIYKLVSEHYRDCNGNSSAHVQGKGSWIWFYCYQVYVIQHLPTMLYTLLVGSKVTSCQYTWRIYQPQDESC